MGDLIIHNDVKAINGINAQKLQDVNIAEKPSSAELNNTSLYVTRAENRFKYSEDLNNTTMWIHPDITVVNPDGGVVIADGSKPYARISSDINIMLPSGIETVTYEVLFIDDACQVVEHVQQQGGSDKHGAKFDVKHGIIGGSPSSYFSNNTMELLPDGWYRIKVEFTRTSNSASYTDLRFDGTLSEIRVVGDGVNPKIKVRNLQVVKGSIADNIEYVKTTDTPIIGDYHLDWVKNAGLTKIQPVASSSATLDNQSAVILVTYTPTGAVTITIPSAEISRSGRTFEIIDSGGNAGTNNITIETEGSETINGNTNATMSTNYATLKLISDGTNLLIM